MHSRIYNKGHNQMNTDQFEKAMRLVDEYATFYYMYSKALDENTQTEKEWIRAKNEKRDQIIKFFSLL